MLGLIRPWKRSHNRKLIQQNADDYATRCARYAMRHSPHRRFIGMDAAYSERRVMRPRVVGDDYNGWSSVEGGKTYQAESREQAVAWCMEARAADRRFVVRAGVYHARRVRQYRRTFAA